MFRNDDPLFITLNKMRGHSSAFELNKLKKLLGIKKAGFCGTLDPIADGVLVVACGKATKLISKVTDCDKTYSGTMKLGFTSPSFDTDTELVLSGKVPEISQLMLHEIEKKFTGTIRQIPPVYSALKINGRRACDLARKGIEGIELKLQEREVKVSSIRLEKSDLGLLSFRIECSKGTYIRSIVNDIGKILGCGAVMESLTRERVGVFSVEKSVSVPELMENLASVDKAVMTMEEFLSIFADSEQ